MFCGELNHCELRGVALA